MLSFRELADYLRNDPNRLGVVSSIPLNRVRWTKGTYDGEFLVMGDASSIMAPGDVPTSSRA